MRYFIDTEFLEGPQKKTFLGFTIGETKPTIDLISIGIVAEDGREYYAISKDFNLKEAWNRYDMKQYSGDMRNHRPEGYKEYWLRENVLYPIFWELYQKDYPNKSKEVYGNLGNFMGDMERHESGFSLFERLLFRYGKTNNQIAEEVKEFCHFWNTLDSGRSLQNHPIEFYAYYADYDWVVFCWLFGKMMDLPKGFPMYCKDLKQILDDKADKYLPHTVWQNQSQVLDYIKKMTDYPKQDPSKSHNAIEDARWNKQLFEFLNKL
jgi:hypothetical protein